MAIKPTKYLFQPRYFPPVWLTVAEIADYLERDGLAVRQALDKLPEGAALRASDLPPLVGDGGQTVPDPAVTRELAHAGTYLPFSRWGELVSYGEPRAGSFET
jgi:hypothetical protein